MPVGAVAGPTEDTLAPTLTPHALLFTDIVDSTRTVARLGDAAAAQLWAEHDRRSRALLARHGGREIDRSDGFFLLFDNAGAAARFAFDYHRALAQLGLSARAGIHLGEVALRENSAEDIARGAKPLEVDGIAKPTAARLMSLAGGGQTLASAACSAAVEAQGLRVHSHGRYRLKGLPEPLEVLELGEGPAPVFTPPADAEKAYRVVQDGDLWRPAREVPHNLPAERDAFVGRRAELAALAELLEGGARLLTVLGSGGIGKTRFVTRHARLWLGDWPGGVFFCDLSEARSLDGVCAAVALALGLQLQKGDPATLIGDAIAGRGRCLLIVDNFEQVVEHAAVTVGAWADRAGQASFVVTSRELLHLPGETVFTLAPLRLADEAQELFALRARTQRPGFEPGPAQRDAVARICTLLDGLPLAIELAAARVRLLSPEQIADRLRDRFALLGNPRGAGARQATLRAAIDWSWALLTPWEQAALAQCSVFEGGFTLDAAEQVLDLGEWPGAPPVLDAVQSLVDKSLLRSWMPGEAERLEIDEPYFGMYLSVHDYAAEKRRASERAGERGAEQRHGHHFAGFGSDAAMDLLRRPGGIRRLRALAREIDNLVAACRRALQRREPETALGAYRAAWEVLALRGPFALGVALGDELLALPDLPEPLRALAEELHGTAALRAGRMDAARASLPAALERQQRLGNHHRLPGVQVSLGILSHVEGRSDEARRHFEAAVQGYRASGDRNGEALALGNLGSLEDEMGRLDEAVAHYEAAIAILRQTGHRRHEGMVMGNLAALLTDQGRAAAALPHYLAALAIHREVGSRRDEAGVLGNLGVLHHAQGQLDEAEAHFRQALELHRSVGNRPVAGSLLSNLGVVARQRGDNAAAADYFAEALVIARESGNRRFEGGMLGGQGELLLDMGRIDEARQVLLEGEALLRGVGDRLELAKLVCVRGCTDVRIGDLASARAALAEALAISEALHATEESELGASIARLRGELAG